MKKQLKNLTSLFLGVLIVSAVSCKKDEEDVKIKEGIKEAQLIFTEVNGEAHGDHFHGLAEKDGGDSFTVKFNDSGDATSGGHLHLEADAVYKLELKAWDYTGKEVQNDYIASKSVADNFKAFLVGGDFKLNTQTTDESGAVFQTRELTYGDGSAVTGKYETTGITSYLTLGHSNEKPTVQVRYILRKLDAGVKGKIERTDWNDKNYAARFAGKNELELKFEIHAESGHQH